MELTDILALVKAGYTRDEIAQMDTQTPVQPNAEPVPVVETPQIAEPVAVPTPTPVAVPVAEPVPTPPPTQTPPQEQPQAAPMDGASPAPAGDPMMGGDPMAGEQPPMDGQDPAMGGDPMAGGEAPMDGQDPAMGGDPMMGDPAMGGDPMAGGEAPMEGGEGDDSTMSIINQLSDEDREAVRAYAESMLNKSEGEQEAPAGEDPMMGDPAMGGEQPPMMESFIFTKKQLNKIVCIDKINE